MRRCDTCGAEIVSISFTQNVEHRCGPTYEDLVRRGDEVMRQARAAIKDLVNVVERCAAALAPLVAIADEQDAYPDSPLPTENLSYADCVRARDLVRTK